MVTMKYFFTDVAVAAVLATCTSVRADNLAEAAAKASALVNRPIAASPHALEEFPCLLRGYSPQTMLSEQIQSMATYPDDLAAAAKKASALVNRPIAASPHALQGFPAALRGYSMRTPATEPVPKSDTYPDNLAAAAKKASSLVNWPIAASPHALEEFPELLRGYSVQAEMNQMSQSTEPYKKNAEHSYLR